MDAANRNPQVEDMDRWLDRALRERANAEPRNGLEERVLARLAARPPNRIAWWPVMATVAAVVVIAVALVVMYPKQRVWQQPTGPSPETSLPTTGAAKQGIRSTASPIIRQREACCISRRTMPTTKSREAARSSLDLAPAAGPEALPKLATFPAPRPETAEERMLARLAARSGSYDLANASSDMVPLKDLSVAELKIQPMEGTPPDNTSQK